MSAVHEGPQTLRHFYFLMIDEMRMITDAAMEVRFGLRLLDRAAYHAYCHNISWCHPDPGNAAPAVLVK